MNYYILNKTSNQYLTFPKTGVWSTKDLKLAQEMLDICFSYIKYLDIPNYMNNFIIDQKEV